MASILTKDGKAYINKEGKVLTSRASSSVVNGLPIEISRSEEMQAVLVAENVGKIYKYVGETNETYSNGNLYQIVEESE